MINELKKTRFPKIIRSVALSRVWLEAFRPELSDELWQLVVSDRTQGSRQNVWPGNDTAEELGLYVESCNCDDPESPEFAYLIRDASGLLVGTFHVHNVSWYHQKVEVGFWLHHHSVGRGWVTEALKLMEDVLRKTGFQRIEIRCDPRNERSCRLAEKNGYLQEGVLKQNDRKDDEFCDTAIYAKLL